MSASVLIVDDQEIGRITLEGFLLPLGYDLHYATSGSEALDKLDGVQPDVILLDVMMPGMDGFSVCERIRENRSWRDVPIILITALDDRESRIKGLSVGADDFVSKPVDWAELQARVRTTVSLGRTRRQLQERKRFEWAVTKSNDGFAWLDADGLLLGMNPTSRRWLGWRDSTQCKGPWLDRIARKFIVQPERSWEMLTKGKQAVQFTIVRPRTEQVEAFWLECTFARLPDVGDEPGGWMGHLQDVTMLEIRVQQFASLLNMLSHKINTPLATTKSALEMLELNLDDEMMALGLLRMATSGIEQLEAEARQLMQVVESARHPAFDIGQMSGQAAVVACAREICASFELSPDDCTLQITHTRPFPLGRKAFERVLSQLLDNAIKFHPRNSPTVLVKIADEGEDFICISVEDDGPGIPPERWGQVWEPLYQVDREGAGRVPGMGIGLSQVAYTVWQVGGRCWIERSAAGGTRVCLRLPSPYR